MNAPGEQVLDTPTRRQSILSSHTLSLNISERKLLLFVLDILFLSISFFTTVLIPIEKVNAFHSSWNDVLWLIMFCIIWYILATTLHLYNLSIAAQSYRSVGRVIIAGCVISSIYILITNTLSLLPSLHYSSLLFPTTSIISISTWRIFYALILVKPGLHHRALLVGSGRSMVHLTGVIQELSPPRNFGNIFGYNFIGQVSDYEVQDNVYSPGSQLGTLSDLRSIIYTHHPHELVLSDEIMSALTHSEFVPGRPQRRHYDSICIELFSLILECRELGISITTAGTVYEHLTGRVPVGQLGRSLNVALPLNQSSTYRLYLMTRRLVDIVISLIGCLFLLLIVPIIWVANRLTSPGPLLYSQERVGEGGCMFHVIKFRSMIVDAEKHVGAVWASENDPRITPVGRFLRKTRLDEIPQFWNILKGDMSLIGPRPERPQFVNRLAKEIPYYRARHAVKPGLTGWAQVRYHYGASLEDALMKLQYDLYYIKRISLLMDIQIVLLTIPVIFGFKGR